MRICSGILIGLLGAAGVSELSSEELEYARKKFAVLREYPDELSRLRQAAERFESLPAERQTQLRHLDHELNNQPSAVQARLHDALDRYQEWLEHLDPKDRERVRAAPDKNARLLIIRQLRQQEWIARQPQVFRDAVAKLPEAARAERVAKAWHDERKRQPEWTVARRFWKDMAENKPLPTKPDDLDAGTRTYVTDVLTRVLSAEERERLTKSEGQWPLYPQTLVELADKHPPALPSENAPRSYAELPKPVQVGFGKKGILKPAIIEKRLKPYEGRPLEFANQFSKLARESNVTLPFEWWVSSFNGLSQGMQEFVKKKLVEPLLDRKEWRMLIDAEGKWPEYPETIQKLADAHNLPVPWFTLPGGRERWDPYRAGRTPTAPGYPEVPKYKLRGFVFLDLDDTDRKKLKNELDRARSRDGEAWGSIVEAFFQHYPSELSRLRSLDRARAGG